MSDRPDEIIEVREELPANSPVTAAISAGGQAMVTVLTRHMGRKAALEFLDLWEGYLMDPRTLDNVYLIRGEEQRQELLRNRAVALNWLRWLNPMFRRAMRK